jgi:hypothetical protein
MAYLLNLHHLAKLYRSDEHSEEAASWTDANGMELMYDGSLIKIRDFNVRLRDEYFRIVDEEIFMGFEAPQDITPYSIDIASIIDDPKNRTPGHCFLDNLANPFHGWGDVFATWLLSIPELRAKFTYLHEGEIIWRPGPCLELMGAFDRANDKMTLAGVVGAAACGRGTEMANELLRNSTATPIRNVQILFHNFCLIGILEKTSHKRLQQRFIPVAPPDILAKHFIFTLAVFRPFQVYVAHQFLGVKEARRFHEYLYPRLRGNLTSDALSKMLAQETEDVIGARLGMMKWRKVVGTICRRHGDPHAYELAKTYFFDIVEHHSATTANFVYQQASGSLTGISPEHVVGCIKHSIAWQKITGIDEDRPLTVVSV